MSKPWTDGPRELILHAVDHLSSGSDFDRRIAMISIDNSVELMAKVFLGLPKRARKNPGPGRKELEAAEGFPDLLDLLEKHAGDRLKGIGLDDVEWYHRLRNQLYHSGNGITVEREKVETYLGLARSLFEGLFEEALDLPAAGSQTGVGRFMESWIQLERLQRSSERFGAVAGVTELSPGFSRRAGAWEFERIDASLVPVFESARRFRNELVHGLSAPDPEELNKQIGAVKKLIAALAPK